MSVLVLVITSNSAVKRGKIYNRKVLPGSTADEVLSPPLDVRSFAGGDYIDVAIEAPPFEENIVQEFYIEVCPLSTTLKCIEKRIRRQGWTTVCHGSHLR